ncbi:MAG: hypothetical protein R6V40_04330 [Candidatus Moraniibacteriota bacterium]
MSSLKTIKFSETVSDWARSQVVSILEKTGYMGEFDIFHCVFEKNGVIHIKWILSYLVNKTNDHKEPVDLRNVTNNKRFFMLITGLTEAYGLQFSYVNYLRSLGYQIKFEYVLQNFKVEPKSYISELEKCDKAVQVRCKRLSR